MAVTIRVQTDFGPYQPGTVLITSVFHANRIIQVYGQGKRIVDQMGRPGRVYDGAVLTVTDEFFPPPGRDTLTVTFRIDVGRYDRGRTYDLELHEVRRMLRNHPDVVLYDSRDRAVPENRLDEYARIGARLFADRLLYLYNQPNGMNVQ